MTMMYGPRTHAFDDMVERASRAELRAAMPPLFDVAPGRKGEEAQNVRVV